MDQRLKVEVERKVAEWEKDKNIGIAADLLNFSYIEQFQNILEAPSRFILDNKAFLPEPLIHLATRNLKHDTRYDPLEAEHYCQFEIATLKRRLLINPRDSLALVDIARLYAAQGQNDHAKRAIITASALEPRHRFVVRSASRFFVHDGDPDHAFHILNRSGRGAHDPWILSALISVQTVQGKTPLNLRKARLMLEDGNFAPKDVAELGAAISTVMVEAGEVRNAKRILNKALREPNDNVVAQAVWAATELQIPLNLRSEWPQDAEATYYRAEDEGDFEMAYTAALDWFRDEPFSTRPLRGAAFAASLCQKFDKAELVTRQALRLDPHSIEGKNNLAFSLLAQSKFEEAHQTLSQIIHTEASSGLTGHTLANLGMFAYRNDDIESGRRTYEQACEALSKLQHSHSFVLCCAYWANEAKMAGDPEARMIFDKAKTIVDRSTSAAARCILNLAAGAEQQIGSTKGQRVNSSVEVTHDAKRNILILERRDAFPVPRK